MNLANQWGRDTAFQPGRRSAGPLIVVAIISLTLGLAGGYAAGRFLLPDLFGQMAIIAPPVEQDPEIARLSEALAQASKDLNAARAAEAARSAEVEDLKAQTTRQAEELDAMAERLAEMSKEARPSVIETAAAVEALTRERNALASDNQTLAAENQTLASENQSVAAELAALEAAREKLRQEADAARSRLEDELARLNGQIVPELTSERDQLQRQASLLLADQAALSARVKAAEQARVADARRIAELETRLEKAGHQLAAAQAALAARAAETTKTPDIAGSEAGSGAGDPSAAKGGAAPAQDGSAPTPRDPDDVAAALQSAPGVAALSSADRRRLAEQLASGDCVTTALETVFDRVPILTLRNLIRDLDSDC